MTTLRDEIADILNEPEIEWDVVPDYDDAGNEIGERLDPYLTDWERERLADAILALIRERLTSDDAANAASDEYWDKTPDKSKSMCIPAMRLAILAALDAVMQDDSDERTR